MAVRQQWINEAGLERVWSPRGPRTLSSGELPSARRTARAPIKKTRLELDFLRLGLALAARAEGLDAKRPEGRAR